jgi:SAM-dependent methyltransferase
MCGARIGEDGDHPARDRGRSPVEVQAAYDAVADAYHEQLADELDHKPLDRALLTGLVELAGTGTIGDVGCGPGHVTRFLAACQYQLRPGSRPTADVIGIDLSPRMVGIARAQAPSLPFAVGSMLALPVPDRAWAGAVALYSIIHLAARQRAVACREFGRVLRPGGWLLVGFHVDSPDGAAGTVYRPAAWFGRPVDLDVHFLEPAGVAADLESAGFTVMSRVERRPWPDVEYPSRRCYLLARR